MYGIINKAIEELAIKSGGQEAWTQIRRFAGCGQHDFMTMQDYPDSVTYRLVEAASAVLEVPADELLRQFGRHWILYTGDKGYGPIMSAFGDNVRDFMRNLNSMHTSILGAMPRLRPPRFSVENVSDQLIRVHYISERPGLAQMVWGLLEGLGEKFNEPLQVWQVADRNLGADHDEFEIFFH